ncbi:hypothetical protein DAKH74_030020 [Maudiozyma humilis]|uniref:PXA domain-containing protein n=1 Tax=Maudiozyma humilis TaxID=51915 RepID=A0AAV5RYB5_MAUHU|nr:hypothetical protein DAKH74_030020 [Kazachstania humilis]
MVIFKKQLTEKRINNGRKLNNKETFYNEYHTWRTTVRRLLEGIKRMSSILYNTNSSFIQRYQRNNLRQNRFTQNNHSKNGAITNNSEEHVDDVPFVSKYDKDSQKYLQELCKSCFPPSLHQRIRNLKASPDLEIVALVSLVYKNFISTWYGPKIPTMDDQFPTEVFNLIERLISFGRQAEIDFKSILLDEFAALLSTHINAIRELSGTIEDPDTFYEKYCQLTLYDQDTYPYVITELVQQSLHSQSLLQSTFIDGILDELLLGRIFDSISEPYYLLRGISKICTKIIQRKIQIENHKQLSIWTKLKLKVRTIVSSFNYISSINIQKDTVTDSPITGRYISHTIFVDLLQLEIKKPLLYYTLRCAKELTLRSSLFTDISNNALNNILQKRLTNNLAIGSYIRLIRHTIFPNDNGMGPRTVIPTGEEFEEFKRQRVSEISTVLELHHVSSILSISQDQISEFVECISVNQKCNKLLYYRFVDCLLAHMVKSDMNVI